MSIEGQKIDEIFAQNLHSYTLNHEQDLSQIFQQITQGIDANFVENQSLDKNYNLEWKLWGLVFNLTDARMKHFQETRENFLTEYNSDLEFLNDKLSKDLELKELCVIANWVKENLYFLDLEDDQVDGNKWINTKLALQEDNIAKIYPDNNKKKNWMVNKLDQDAIIRQNKLIHPQDMANDVNFMKKLYRLILCGRDEEAIELCEKSNNWTFYMILQGLSAYYDPVVDKSDGEFEDGIPTGIKDQYLWRRNVLKLGQYAKSDNVFEKCLFEYLGGGVQNNLLLNKNDWDICLLVYLNGLIKQNSEDYLINEVGKLKDYQPLKIPELINSNTLENILSELINMPGLNQKAFHQLRLIMTSIMTNNVTGYLTHFLNIDYNAELLSHQDNNSYTDLDDDLLDISDFNQVIFTDENGDYEEQGEELIRILKTNPDYDSKNYLSRVLVHLVIYLKINNSGNISDEELTSLIKIYLRKLFKKELFQWLPIYIKYLPNNNDFQIEQQKKIYAYYLSKIINKENRQLQISNAKHLNFENLKEILLETVDLMINKYQPYYENYESSHINFEVSQIDQIYYSSIDWLIYHANSHVIAIGFINKIFTNFLINGKIGAILEFYKSLSFMEILKKADIEMSINANYNSDTDNSSDTDDLMIDDDNDYKNQKQYLLNLINLIKNGLLRIIDCENYLIEGNNIRDTLIGKFFVPLYKFIHEDLEGLIISQEPKINEFIKKLYIPYFIISFHNLLINSQDFDDSFDKSTTNSLSSATTPSSIGEEFNEKFIKIAINLSISVASTKHNFLKYFKESNNLKNYLKLVAESCAVAGENVIYEK